MTPQEIFETAAQHLLGQNQRAVDPGTVNCAYRTSNGLQCAVGCLIPDELYDRRMEGWGVVHIDGEMPSDGVVTLNRVLEEAFGRELDNTDKAVLRELQNIHDDAEPHQWKQKLQNMAANMPELEVPEFLVA